MRARPTKFEAELLARIAALNAEVADLGRKCEQLKKFMEFNGRSFEIMIERHGAEVDRLNALLMEYHVREQMRCSDERQN